jgi:hypothetical protein
MMSFLFILGVINQSKEPLLKGKVKAQYSSPPCTNKLRSDAVDIANRGCIFSCVQLFYEQAVSHLDP